MEAENQALEKLADASLRSVLQEPVVLNLEKHAEELEDVHLREDVHPRDVKHVQTKERSAQEEQNVAQEEAADLSLERLVENVDAVHQRDVHQREDVHQRDVKLVLTKERNAAKEQSVVQREAADLSLERHAERLNRFP